MLPFFGFIEEMIEIESDLPTEHIKSIIQGHFDEFRYKSTYQYTMNTKKFHTSIDNTFMFKFICTIKH